MQRLILGVSSFFVVLLCPASDVGDCLARTVDGVRFVVPPQAKEKMAFFTARDRWVERGGRGDDHVPVDSRTLADLLDVVETGATITQDFTPLRLSQLVQAAEFFGTDESIMKQLRKQLNGRYQWFSTHVLPQKEVKGVHFAGEDNLCGIDDASVTIWNLATGRPRAIWEIPLLEGASFCASQIGDFVAYLEAVNAYDFIFGYTNRDFVVRNVERGEVVERLRVFTTDITKPCFSPEGGHVALNVKNGIKLFAVHPRVWSELSDAEWGGAPIFCFNRDGAKLATFEKKCGKLAVFTVATGAVERELVRFEPGGSVLLYFNPSFDQLAAVRAYAQRCNLHLFDVETGEETASFLLSSWFEKDLSRKACYHPDGTKIAFVQKNGACKEIVIHDTKTGAKECSVPCMWDEDLDQYAPTGELVSSLSGGDVIMCQRTKPFVIEGAGFFLSIGCDSCPTDGQRQGLLLAKPFCFSTDGTKLAVLNRENAAMSVYAKMAGEDLARVEGLQVAGKLISRRGESACSKVCCSVQ